MLQEQLPWAESTSKIDQSWQGGRELEGDQPRDITVESSCREALEKREKHPSPWKGRDGSHSNCFHLLVTNILDGNSLWGAGFIVADRLRGSQSNCQRRHSGWSSWW